MSCMIALNYRNQAIALTEICGQTVCRNSGGRGESRPLALKRGHILDGLAARVISCPSRPFPSRSLFRGIKPVPSGAKALLLSLVTARLKPRPFKAATYGTNLRDTTLETTLPSPGNA